MPLEEAISGLQATSPAPLPFMTSVSVRAFLLKRAAGNLIVYNAPGLTADAAEIQALGGATRQLINHGHEEMFEDPGLDVPVFVHERDRAEAARSLPIAGTFLKRETIDEDLEVIPIPGHTPGSTAFLWDSGDHRFLFTGDSIWINQGSWSAVVLDPNARGSYLESLALMRDLDFNVLVPWGATEGGPYLDVVSRSEVHERIDAIIERVRTGADR